MYIQLHTVAFYAAIFFTVFGAMLGLIGVWVDDFWDSPTPVRLLITDAILAATSIIVAAITKWLSSSLSVVLLVLAMPAAATTASDLLYTVSRVVDGDTIELHDGRRVRLYGVDAPELQQAYGTRAKRMLELLVLDRAVNLVDERPYSFGRIEARVLWRQVDVSSAMVGRGYAWTDDRAAGPLRQRYLARQQSARQRRSGLWATDNPVAPWEFAATNPQPAQSGTRIVTQQPAQHREVVIYSPPLPTTYVPPRSQPMPANNATMTWGWNGSAYVPMYRSYCSGPNCPR